ncbi:hypothetical protein CDCA_CDCA09G2756 [Cyanidium caldarium]|uniref:Uncharacterized protein n=1 Tax=Cyanidium caldarium TaxID=2771 RepID=A0AAV9IX81_CYACA|nr:hypothetical protein CDCA_CDCA09G2756 [Cyanidium caldarium]
MTFSIKGGPPVPAPSAAIAVVALGVFLLSAPLVLAAAASLSQLLVISLLFGAPALLLGLVPLLGAVGVLLSGALMLLVLPLFSLTMVFKGILWPLAIIMAMGYFQNARKRRWQQVASQNMPPSTTVADVPAATGTERHSTMPDTAEEAAEEEYLRFAREELAQFDERLYGPSAARPSVILGQPHGPDGANAGNALSALPQWIQQNAEGMLRWKPADVARAATIYGVPRRVCQWMEREHIDGRVVLSLTQVERAELLSAAQPPLTFGERKLLRDFLEQMFAASRRRL